MDMKDGNESGKDGELVCTGMVWKRTGRGVLGLCERPRPFQTRCISPRVHVFAGLERHSGIENRIFATGANWSFFKGLTLAMLRD